MNRATRPRPRPRPRQLALLQGFNFIAWKDKCFSLGDSRDGLVVLLFHDAGEAASILQVDGRGAIFVRDDGIGVVRNSPSFLETRQLRVETRQQLDNHLFGCNTPAKCALL